MFFLSINLTEFIGRFHPVLVHMPVGILLLAALFIGLSASKKFQSLREAITISLFLGMLSAIASCVTGFLLSKTDGYDGALLFKHQWFAIAVAVVSALACYLHLKNRDTRWIAALMVLLVMVTGHLGGSITHGSDFLTKAFSSQGTGGGDPFGKPIPNVQDAIVYTAVIKPILEARCISCHGPNKQKGKLRLDEPGFILKGGDESGIVMAGKPLESSMIKRILLSKENKDHMPPREKPQLDRKEIDLLNWWITTGAQFDQKVKNLDQNDRIKLILKSLGSEKIIEEAVSDFPDHTVEKATEATIKQLQDRGIAVVPIARNSNYLSANFVAVESFGEKDLQMLEPIKKQLIWLKLGNLPLSDSNLEIVGKLSSLTRLYLQKTNITDKGLQNLNNLSELQYLNLAWTKITAKGVEQLKGLKNLRQLYLYQTSITAEELNNLEKVFPKVVIDTGGYQVPVQEADTVILKAPIVK